MPYSMQTVFCLLHIYQTTINAWSNPCETPQVSSLPFCNQSLTFEERAYDLAYIQLAKLPNNGLYAYQSLSGSTASGINQLSIPSYQWNTNAPHGMCSAPGCNFLGPIKNATMFPQVIATASSFNTTLFHEIGRIISTEARVMHHFNQSGLTIWTPNINIYRDPRWGRGQETAGEDPFLTSQYAIHFVRGLQGDDERYLQTSACCKHFVDYSLENSDGVSRHNFNAVVNEYDQNDTFLVAFKYCVTDANVSGLMCSYNAINGVPSCADEKYLTEYIRDDWGFDGYITADCDAVRDVQQGHHYTNTTGDTIKDVFSAGLDIDCSNSVSYSQKYLADAIENEYVNISVIQKAIYHATLVQMRLGMFDHQSDVPWNNLTQADVLTNYALRLSHEAAQQSIVLLKNKHNILPLSTSASVQFALIGPNAQSVKCMQGNDFGEAPFIYTVQMGLEAYEVNIQYALGCDINSLNISGFAAAISTAKAADITILVMGLDKTQENENDDRESLELTGQQNSLIEQVATVSKICILVVVSGGCIDISQWRDSEHIDAIIYAGYPGMYGGLAIADVLFGEYNPSARLVQTFYYNNYTQQILMSDMNMRANVSTNTSVGRGYRYFDGAVVYPFGFGLSYTEFRCNNLTLSKNSLSITVRNIGTMNGGAVVLMYFVPNSAGRKGIPLKRLIAFGRIHMLKVQTEERITMTIYQEFYQSKEFINFDGEFHASGSCENH